MQRFLSQCLNYCNNKLPKSGGFKGTGFTGGSQLTQSGPKAQRSAIFTKKPPQETLGRFDIVVVALRLKQKLEETA